MAIRKFGKDEKQYEPKKIEKSIRDSKFVLFGSYPWTIDKKSVLQQKVAELFPQIEWIYNKKGELVKQNFDASDAYVACLGQINKERYGELNQVSDNIKKEGDKIEYDVLYWGKKEHRITYIY